MNILKQLANNEALTVAIIGWFCAQVIKFILVIGHDRKVKIERLIGSGGMPSSHSSFATSLSTVVGIRVGFDSVAFAICAVFSLIVMYDATGVRKETGEQAAVLNKIIENFGRETLQVTTERLKELVGHSKIEVLAGALLGIVVGILSQTVF